jgi:hypothetical protein
VIDAILVIAFVAVAVAPWVWPAATDPIDPKQAAGEPLAEPKPSPELCSGGQKEHGK